MAAYVAAAQKYRPHGKSPFKLRNHAVGEYYRLDLNMDMIAVRPERKAQLDDYA